MSKIKLKIDKKWTYIEGPLNLFDIARIYAGNKINYSDPYKFSLLKPEIEKWFKEKKINYLATGDDIIFFSQQDATLFRLTW